MIIESLSFVAQQGIALRGHEEDRLTPWEVSDINSGNFLELLHMRSKDLPWLKEKLRSQLNNYAQWTSPDIQNELLSIVAKCILRGSKPKLMKINIMGLSLMKQVISAKSRKFPSA